MSVAGYLSTIRVHSTLREAKEFETETFAYTGADGGATEGSMNSPPSVSVNSHHAGTPCRTGPTNRSKLSYGTGSNNQCPRGRFFSFNLALSTAATTCNPGFRFSRNSSDSVFGDSADSGTQMFHMFLLTTDFNARQASVGAGSGSGSGLGSGSGSTL